MIKFQDFIFENTSYLISFLYKGEKKEFTSSTRKGIYTSLIDWLYENGYEFKGYSLSDRLLTLDQVKNLIKTSKTYRLDHFHNIKNSGNFIVMNAGIDQLMTNLIKMLSEMGVDKNDIHFSKGKNEITGISTSEEFKKMTFIEAAQYVLKKNENKPMTSFEVWEQSEDLVSTSGKTPWDSMNAQMILYSENTTAKGKKKNSLFRIIEGRPYKFILINPNLEVQSVPDEDLILPPSEFIEKKDKPKDYSKNPFRQSICVLGESGAGKSVTIENILEFEGHNFEFIIPTAATTGLLAQFSPSRSGYVSSRLGRMLIAASKNPQELYTAVFDEMHKSNVIEMINDELLQAISTKRNREVRFISLDDDTAEIYSDSELETRRGNLIIPDNFGFIFISSKPRVISNNADFFNRVDIIILTSADREIKTSDELLSKVLPEEEKMKLASSRND